MATANLSAYDFNAVPDGSPFTIHLVVSQWNNEITKALCDRAVTTLEQHGKKFKY